MLRAHGLLRKVPHSHRYQLTDAVLRPAYARNFRDQLSHMTATADGAVSITGRYAFLKRLIAVIRAFCVEGLGVSCPVREYGRALSAELSSMIARLPL